MIKEDGVIVRAHVDIAMEKTKTGGGDGCMFQRFEALTAIFKSRDFKPEII